MLTLDD